MKCNICGGDLEQGATLGGKVFAYVCVKCGEPFFMKDMVERIEQAETQNASLAAELGFLKHEAAIWGAQYREIFAEKEKAEAELLEARKVIADLKKVIEFNQATAENKKEGA